MMVLRLLVTILMLAVSALFLASLAAAQDSGTVFDDAGALSQSEEQKVEAAFEGAGAESGDPLYAFLESDTNLESVEQQRGLLMDQAREAGAPSDAGVILVDTEDEWVQTYNVDQSVYDAMVPHFQDGDFAEGLIVGAAQYEDSLSVLPEVLTTGGVLAALVALAGGALLLRNRRRKERELAEQRELAEREFAELTERMDEFGEKERLVAGYLEAQRPLLDQRSEEEVEAKIRDARSAGFGREFNEAAASLSSDPRTAREKIENGQRLLEGALGGLAEAESTIEHYRAADEALEGRLRVAAEEIDVAEIAERSARRAGASVEARDHLRPEYDRLARKAADRAARRDEFDPRKALAAVEALVEDARRVRAAMEAEVSARAALPEERSATEGALSRAQETLEEYGRAYAA